MKIPSFPYFIPFVIILHPSLPNLSSSIYPPSFLALDISSFSRLSSSLFFSVLPHSLIVSPAPSLFRSSFYKHTQYTLLPLFPSFSPFFASLHILYRFSYISSLFLLFFYLLSLPPSSLFFLCFLHFIIIFPFPFLFPSPLPCSSTSIFFFLPVLNLSTAPLLLSTLMASPGHVPFPFFLPRSLHIIPNTLITFITNPLSMLYIPSPLLHSLSSQAPV